MTRQSPIVHRFLAFLGLSGKTNVTRKLVVARSMIALLIIILLALFLYVLLLAFTAD
jgi:hypothetical protein